MATSTTPGNKHTTQNILNWSFDSDYNVLAIGLLGYDGSNLVRIKTNADGELVVSTGGGEQGLQLDDVSTTNVIYVGVAPIGTATSAAAWQIKKINESGTPITLTVTWADGNSNYDNIYDNRTSLSYS